MRLYLVGVYISLFAGCVVESCLPTHGLTDDEIASIDRIVNKVRTCRNSPGITVAVVKDTETVLKKGYGKADLENDVSVTEKTLFPIASMSKQMSATLLAILMSKYKISWDTKIRDIVPDFKMPSDYMTLTTSLEDIVAHRTGLPSNDMMWLTGAFTREEAYERIKYFEPVFEFRDEFLYNGMTYSIIAKICKALTGRSWEELMREYIFGPLDMASSTFYDRSAINNSQFAKPYVKDGDMPYQHIDQNATAYSGVVGPAGSVASNAEDMAKYMQFLTRKGTFANGTIYIFQRTLGRLFKPLMVIPPAWLGGYLELPVTPHKRTQTDYAHGWIVGTYRDNDVIYHLGNLYGFDGMLALYPETNSAVFTNVNGPMGRDAVINNLLIQNYIGDLLLGKEPWLNETTVCTYPAPWKTKRENYVGNRQSMDPTEDLAPTRPLTDYVGTYGNLAHGNVTIFINETTTKLQLNYGELGRWKLFPSGKKNRFSVEVFGHLSFMKEMSTKYISLAAVQFRSLFGNPVDVLTVSMFDYGHPPVFYRGLLLKDGEHMYRKSDCDFN